MHTLTAIHSILDKSLLWLTDVSVRNQYNHSCIGNIIFLGYHALQGPRPVTQNQRLVGALQNIFV